MRRILTFSVIGLLAAGLTQVEAQTIKPSRETRHVQGGGQDDGVRSQTATATHGGDSYRASEVIGLNVQNAAGDTVGEISDLVIDPDGKISYVALSVGGFLGMGDKLFAIPFDAFHCRHDGDDVVVTLDVTPDTFENAQGFDQDHWPNMTDRRWREDTASRYKSVNRSRTEADREGLDADNTGVNARDVKTRNWTAFDQSNKQADIDLVANLRSEVLKLDNLSMNARNIKIITNAGHVVLRGPVKSVGEREAIEKVVRRIAGDDNIDNQIEVEKNP